MRWFACFARSPEVDGNETIIQAGKNTSSAKTAAPLKLEKQDSAFLERSELQPTAVAAAAALREVSDSPEDTFDNPISSEYSIQKSAQGRVADFCTYGPPKPGCNDARLANMEELGVMQKPPNNAQIKHIMQLMCTVFNTESALVALVGDDQVYIHDAVNFKIGDWPWRQSFCAHTLTPPNHQVMVIEDASKDARLQHLPLVRSGQLRFYAGTPIVSSKGHRLGTVCFAGKDPRKFDAEGCNMLINMGELVTRELERDWASSFQAKPISSKPSDAPQLIRAIECFNDAVIFIDVSAPNWKILHLNTAAQTRLKLFGVSPETMQESSMWDLFEPSDAPWENYSKDVKACRKFEVPTVRFIGEEGYSPVFCMTFRSAAKDVIDSNSAKIGTPASIPSTKSNREYYFVTLTHSQVSDSGTSNNSLRYAAGNADIDHVPFPGVELGPLLGKGGYGRVYRAIQDDQVVAVKVIDSTASLRMIEGQPLEAVITRDAQHPNVLKTLDFAMARSPADAASDTGEERFDSASSRNRHRQDFETWMVLEFCDSGCLQEASDKGFFFRDSRPHLPAILAIARDVAAGMAFLHERGVAHGDLTGGNVLLASDSTSLAGVTAKIADFGLSRSLDVKSKIETRTYGTVTHMPPELLEKGIFSRAADTYALGVLLWELYHGVRAWASMNHAQIITAVAVNKRSLLFQEGAPEGYAKLAQSLMSRDPAERPSFQQVLVALDGIIAAS